MLRSATEGAVLTAVIIGALRWKVEPGLFVPAVIGILAAYGASTLSVGILAAARLRKVEFRGFLRAYGAGVGIRAGVLAALIISAWGEPVKMQSALLASYALGVLVLLLVEYRQIAGQTG